MSTIKKSTADGSPKCLGNSFFSKKNAQMIGYGFFCGPAAQKTHLNLGLQQNYIIPGYQLLP